MPRPPPPDASEDTSESGSGLAQPAARPGGQAAGGRLVVKTPSEGSESSDDENAGLEPESDLEPFDDEDRKPAGDKVERIHLPVSIREMYLFLELVHDSGVGRRVYLCEEPSKPGKLAQDDKPAAGRGRHAVMAMHVTNARLALQEAEKQEKARDHRMTVEGAVGQSRRCIVKVWQKAARSSKDTEEWLAIQLKLLRMERHPNLMQPRRIIEDEQAYYVEFDAVLVGCSVLSMVLNDASSTERQVRSIIRGILNGLSHLQKHGLAHRDIRPENVMLEWKDVHSLLAKYAKAPKGWRSSKKGVSHWHPASKFKNAWSRHSLTAYVRIIDLDTVSGPKATDICGTPGYMAPEAYLGNAGIPGDLFGVGVLLYMLVRCAAPFHDVVYEVLGVERLEAVPRMTRQRIADAVAQTCDSDSLAWSGQPWDAIPMACMFCKSLLKAEPRFRGSDALDLLRTSPWFQREKENQDVSKHLEHLREKLKWDDDDEDADTEAVALMPVARDVTGRRGNVQISVAGLPDQSVSAPEDEPDH